MNCIFVKNKSNNIYCPWTARAVLRLINQLINLLALFTQQINFCYKNGYMLPTGQWYASSIVTT